MSLSDAERAAGLTRPLPPDETILWQERPRARAMASSVFHLRGVALYFAVAAVGVAWFAHRGGLAWPQSVATATLLLPVAAVVTAILAILGRMTANATVYTLTNRRLILHIGVAYEMTVSVPLSAVKSAALRRAGRGTAGDITLSVRDTGATNYVALWPHARPWRWRRPEPMLRALGDVEGAAQRIEDALVAFNTGRHRRPMPAPTLTPALRAVAA